MEKNREMEKYRTETEKIIEELKAANIEKRHDDTKEKNKQQYEEKIAQLESECAATKESEEKLNEMLSHIVENVKAREE